MTSKIKVRKVLNNNAILGFQGLDEVIVIGLGIGFNLRMGSNVPQDKIEKTFTLSKEDLVKTRQLVQDIPDDSFLEISRILQEASQTQKVELDDHAYMALVDHIYFAIERFKSGQLIKNLMLFDLKIMYEDAYRLSETILNKINSYYQLDLPQDEIGFLTMHIVNGMDSSLNNQSGLMTDMIYDILNKIRDTYLIPLPMDHLDTKRIIVHIKMLLRRVITNNQVDESENFLYNVFVEFESAYNLALEIQKYIETRLNIKMHEQELVYLTIHLHRIQRN